jgi:hypothetical protein
VGSAEQARPDRVREVQCKVADSGTTCKYGG